MKTSSPIRALATLACILCADIALAHGNMYQELESESLSGTLAADLNMRSLHGDNPWPTPMPVLGISGADQRGWLFGESSVGWHANWLHGLSTDLVIGYEDEDHRWHIDEANLKYSVPREDFHLQATAGRLSPAFSHAGLPPWGLTNLFNQAVIGHDHWHDDGVEGSVYGNSLSGFGGIYSGRGYPGGASQSGSGMLAAGMVWQTAPLRLVLNGAHVSDFNRVLSTVGDGHNHTHGSSVSGCGVSVDCVLGNADLLWIDARWKHGTSFEFFASLASRREHGSVQSVLGEQAYRGDVNGLALQADWQMYPQWQLGLRQEWLRIANDLSGPNSAAVARVFGLDNAESNPSRSGVRIAWNINRQHQFAIDAYRDMTTSQSSWLWLAQWQMHLDYRY